MKTWESPLIGLDYAQGELVASGTRVWEWEWGRGSGGNYQPGRPSFRWLIDWIYTYEITGRCPGAD